ncbi:hypothetical protein ACM66B_000467 [Microbotryomycetes sp. NB124-2]
MDDNPYIMYRLEIEDAVFDSPGRYFRLRIIILAAALALVTTLTALRFGMLLVESRLKSERVWFARFVERGHEKFLVLHQKPIGIVSAFVTTTILLAYSLKVYTFYRDQQYLTQAAGWRNFAFLPLILHGWLGGWSVLQSHLVFMESRSHSWARWIAPLANWSFLLATLAFFVPLLTVAGYTTSRWRLVWSQFYALQTELRALETSWTPGQPSSPPQLYRTFRLTVRQYLVYSTTTKALYASVSGVTAGLNLFAFSLYIALRHQIEFNLYDMDSEDRRPSNAQIRRLALHGVERAKRVQALQYASSTVFQTSVAMVLGSLAFAAYYAWATTVPTVTIELDEPVKWGAVECSAFLIVWIYAFFYLPLSVKLLWDSWVNLPREDPAVLRSRRTASEPKGVS